MKKQDYFFLSLLFMISACSKQDINQTKISRVVSKADFIPNDALKNFALLVEGFKQPADVVIHLQSFNNYGNQLSGGGPSVSISASSTASKEALALTLDQINYQSGSHSIYHLFTPEDKDLIRAKSGTEAQLMLSGVQQTLWKSAVYIPKEPRIGFPHSENYKPGLGMDWDANKDLNVTWEADKNNSLGGVMLTVSAVESKEQQMIYYMAEDNGSFTIPAADLGKFSGGVDVGVYSGSYERKNIENSASSSALFYAIYHTHFYLTLKK